MLRFCTATSLVLTVHLTFPSESPNALSALQNTVSFIVCHLVVETWRALGCGCVKKQQQQLYLSSGFERGDLLPSQWTDI